jgi:hypothetical protein
LAEGVSEEKIKMWRVNNWKNITFYAYFSKHLTIIF